MALMTLPRPRFSFPVRFERKAASRDVATSIVDLSRAPEYPDENPERLARDYFGRIDIIYACITEIMTSAAEAPLFPATVKAGADPVFITAGPLADLLREPNPAASAFEFQELVHLYLQVAGNCYVFKARGPTGQPVALYHIRPDRMRVVPGTREKPAGYVYTTEQSGEIPVAAEDIIHLKRPNPWNEIYGLAPLHVLARNAGLHMSLLGFQKATFDNGGIPGGILKLKRQIVDDDEPERLRAAWRTRFGQGAGGGFENWGRLAVLDADAEFQAVQMELDKMALPDLVGGNELAFCRVFGVPGILVQARLAVEHNGSLGGGNYEQARKSLWDETLSPEIRRVEQGMARGLRDDFSGNWVILSDKSDIQALREDAGEKATRFGDLFQKGGCTQNEYRTAVGLNPIDGGDVFLFAGSLVTAGDIKNGALGGMDDGGLGGWATMSEARAAYGLPPLPGGDIRLVSIKGVEQTTEQLANGEMVVKPPQFSMAITGPTIDALPVALQQIFNPKDLLPPPEPEPPAPLALPAGLLPSPPAIAPAGPPAPELPPQPPEGKRLERKAKVRKLTGEQKTAVSEALTGARTANVEDATGQLEKFFKKLASRAAGVLGSKAKPGAPETKRDGRVTVDDLLPPDADGELAKIIRAICEQTARDTWAALNDTSVFEAVDFDLGSPRVKRLLADAAAHAIDINDTTREALRAILADGYDAGRPVSDIAKGWTDEDGTEHPGVRSVVDETYKNRATTIARTEVMQAQHKAQLARYDAADLGQVEAQDGEDDDECAERNGQVFDLADADDIEDHPNGTLNWLPVFSDGSDDEESDE